MATGRSSTTSRGRTSSRGRGGSSTFDTNSLEGITQFAQQRGAYNRIEDIVEEKPKLSMLQRLGVGLSAFNPAEAILTGREQGALRGVVEYGKGVAQGLGSAVTGTDYNPDRRYFKDVAEELGVENKIAKFGIGFAGDVLLDPSTYFGGALARGLTKGATAAGSKGLSAIGKVAPDTEAGLRMAGTGLKDALGGAFQLGYKATSGAREGVLTFLSKKQQAQLGLASSNLQRLGTGVLTEDQSKELALKLIAGKRAEFELGEKVAEDALSQVNKLFPGMKVANSVEADRILKGLETATQKEIEEIRRSVDAIVKPLFAARQAAVKAGRTLDSKLATSEVGLKGYSKIDDLNRVVDQLKKKLAAIRKSKGAQGVAPLTLDGTVLGGPITAAERAATRNKLIGYEEERLADIIETLSRRLEKTGSGAGAAGAKGAAKEFTPEETIIYAERQIQKLQNDLADKARLLTRATAGRVTGSKLIAQARATGDYSKIEKIAPELVEKLKLASDDPTVQKTIADQLNRSQKMAQTADVANPYETYFPFIRSDKLQRFINETQGMKVGSEGYRKQFKNLLDNESLELDPAKAFFTREWQVVNDKMTRDFLGDFVAAYGRPLETFATSDEAAKAGFQVIREKGIFGKELGYLNKWDSKLIRDALSPEFQSIDMIAKATGFDAITSLFKRSVTGLFVPFHVRNWVSGQIQNFEVLGKEALNPANMNIGRKIAYNMASGKKMPSELIEIGGKQMKFSQLMKPFVNRFSGDTFYTADWEFAVKNGALAQAQGIVSKASLKETIKTAGLGNNAIPFRTARAVGQFIEHQQKATAYVTALGQGKTVKDALKLAEAAGFDYRALTRFESQIMRRIVPFYSFTRKNIELQMRTLGENPQRIRQVMQFFTNMGDTISADERKSLPDYLSESLGIKIDDTPEGLTQYVSNFGTPIEAFAALMGSNPILGAISTTNPILKVPVELAFGKDSFRERDIKDVYDAREYKMAPQFIKDFLQIQEVEKDILKRMPNGDLAKTGTRTQYVANPERLLIARAMFTSRGVTYLDQVFGGDFEGLAQALRLTTGLKPQQFDLEQQKSFDESRKTREAQDELIKIGELGRFTNSFVPKD